MNPKTFNESRIIRPNALSGLEILEGIEWKLSKKSLFVKDEEIIVEDWAEEIDPIIKVQINEGLIKANNIDKSDYDIAVIYEQSVLKDNIVLFQKKLSEFVQEEIPIDLKYKDDVIWNQQSMLRVIVYANNELPDQGLVFGQMIAIKLLSLSSTDIKGNIFHTEFLTPDQFEEKHYHRNSAYVISIAASALDNNFDEAADKHHKVFIARSLEAASNDPLLVVSVVSAFLEDIFILGYEEFADDEIDNNCVLSTFTRKISKGIKIKEEDLIKAARDGKTQPSMIRSYIQDYMKSTHKFIKAHQS
jgi:hypothetical protein